MLQNLLVLFESTRGSPIKRSKAITTQRNQELPRPLWFKQGGSVEFWHNLLNEVIKDDVRKKNFSTGKTEFFDSADVLKYLIALNILGQIYRALKAEMKLYVHRL